MDLTPLPKPAPVVQPGEFRFAAVHLDHGHIYGQCAGLIEAGAELAAVFDPDPAKVAAFRDRFPQAVAVADRKAILEDPSIRLVAAAAVPCERGPLGCLVMAHGKDYFTDKCPFTTLNQLAAARATVHDTKRRYFVYFSERLHVECAVHAGSLIERGAIGKVVQVLGLGPHRLSAAGRPPWFFRKAQYGGILTDIGSHQVEQFLHYSGNTSAEIVHARVANTAHPEFPELEDFGEMNVVGANGATGYHRVDWLTPDGLGTWGDGRTVILGTGGYIELRKYIDVGGSSAGDHLILVDGKAEHRMALTGKVGFPFFGRMIRDCLDRTETAMTQAHIFLAAQLALEAQARADRHRT